MALYEELDSIDVISPIAGKIPISIGDDGQPRVVVGRILEPDIPWLNHRVFHERYCDLWMFHYFKYYRMIPRGCRDCWKTVMKIKTLRQLMSVARTQSEMEYSCKCGLERRGYTGAVGEYRAFWYGRIGEGLEGGRKVFKYVQRAFPGVNLILKRGCTEFENLYHPSSSWDKFAEERNWDSLEDALNKLFRIEDRVLVSTPDLMKPRILKQWIDWAYEHGDETYLDFVNGPPVPKLETYHSSSHKNEDFSGCSPGEPIKVKGGYSDVVTGEKEEQDRPKISLIR